MKRSPLPYVLASTLVLGGLLTVAAGTAGASPFTPQYVTLPICPAVPACVVMDRNRGLSVRGPDGAAYPAGNIYPLPGDRFEVNAAELPAALTAGLTRHKRTGYTGDY